MHRKSIDVLCIFAHCIKINWFAMHFCKMHEKSIDLLCTFEKYIQNQLMFYAFSHGHALDSYQAPPRRGPAAMAVDLVGVTSPRRPSASGRCSPWASACRLAPPHLPQVRHPSRGPPRRPTASLSRGQSSRLPAMPPGRPSCRPGPRWSTQPRRGWAIALAVAQPPV